MAVQTEGNYLNDILKYELENRQSREKVTVLSGQSLSLGAVIGKISKAQAAAAIPNVSGTGNGTMSALRPGPDVQVGNYVIKCTEAVTNGGVFSVTAPDGSVLPSLTLTPGAGGATQYESTHLNFTITDGATDFAVDDTFTVAVTASGTPAVVGTGDGTMSAVTLGRNAQNGTYQVICKTATTNGGTFKVIAPNGESLPDLVLTAGAGTSTAYSNEHINFTITDGSTDFAVGDYFNIVVAQGFGKVKEIDFDGVDGAQNACGFVIAPYDATAGDVEGVAIVRDAQIVDDNLAWPTNATTAQKATAIAQLKELGIVTREEA